MGTIWDRKPCMLTCLAMLITLATTQTVIPTTVSVLPTTTMMTLSGANTSYLDLVCSTWGNYHFKTFDGDMFQLNSTCNHILTSQCQGSYENFNIQMKRQVVNNIPTISRITMKLEGTIVVLYKDSVEVDNLRVNMPYVHSGVSIRNMSSITVQSKLGLLLIWNLADSLRIEMNPKYRNQTCGLCGDFNGVETYNEFIHNGVKQSVSSYGEQWKLNDPLEVCNEPSQGAVESCGDTAVCESLFNTVFGESADHLNFDYFIEACKADMCHCDNNTSFCLCDTLSEFSRQCVQAGGTATQWRTDQFCGKTCPYNMVYQECGNPCADSCSNPQSSQSCSRRCTDGCFCPPDTVFDDVNKTGCIPVQECSCLHDGQMYGTGESYSTKCKDCVCSGGMWSCQQKDCPGTCSVEGGSHINTFDGKLYSFHGACSYVLAKECNGSQFTVLGDLVKCDTLDTQTCLRSITLALGNTPTVIKVQSSGIVSVNQINTQLPLYNAEVSIFQPSSFFIFIQTSVGLQLEVQLVPIMQLYITASPVFKGSTCGLCGNFNDNHVDEFRTISGLVEATPEAFANTWKTMASCSGVSSSITDICSQSVVNEQYAKDSCSKLTDTQGAFASCHSVINPEYYKEKCMYDTCNCEKSEDCMCAAVSSYVHACAAAGIMLNGWRESMCYKYSSSCTLGTVYSYNMVSCGRTCRSFSQTDRSCDQNFTSVDGCGCNEGTYMDQAGQCVEASKCPCYYKDTIIPAGQSTTVYGASCVCKNGMLDCGEIPEGQTGCIAPMVYLNCSNESPGTGGIECGKSCETLDMACISTDCTSGCMCPTTLVADGRGGCIQEDDCPCFHNGAMYQPGQTLKDKCNTCTCKARKWECTTKKCDEVCSMYGDGNYISFDDVRFTFNGGCEYTLLENSCNGNLTSDSFRINTENVPCGNTGTTCSKNIKLYMGANEMLLTDDGYQVLKDNGGPFPQQISKMGIYLVIEVQPGLIVMWDTKTSLFIKMSPAFQGQVCGLCGNYDGNGQNDFTTRNQETVVDPLDFGNSWKNDPTCPNAEAIKPACTINPYRKAWSLKKCSIIRSEVFQECHSEVDPTPYHEACVRDSCACDSGGDCECFCTAVAAYAEACNEAGVCVSWRRPQICPLFCDYYNSPDGCEWHYKPCGAPCMKTCRNPSGNCSSLIHALEGCYPSCPPSKPYFNQDSMTCVPLDQCGCYDYQGNHYTNGARVPALEKNCYTCSCTMSGISCRFDVNACTCLYNGKTYPYGATIYNTTDSIGNCIEAVCGINGEITRNLYPCQTTSAPPTSTTPVTITTASSTTMVYSTLKPTTVFQFSTPEITSPEVTWSTTYEPNITTVQLTTETSTKQTSTESPSTSGQVVSTAQPTTVTTTTSVPSTSTLGTTPIAVETTTQAGTTTGAIVSTSTVPPTVETTGPTTTSTTVVVETTSTQQPSTESPSTSGQVVSTAQPTTVTTTTSVPSTSTLGTTPIAVETTTQAETTTGAIVSTSTVPPTVETTGPTTTATTTVVVETSSTQQPSTESPSTSGQVVSTAQPTTVTTTTSVPSTSTLGTTTIAVETTTQAETTTGAIVSTSTVPPKVETTGPTTTATTVVVETASTQQPSTESPSTSGQIVSTAQPTTVTTTTSLPSTSTLGTTPIAVETTTQAETTTGAIVSTSTVPPKVETTGPTTTATTTVVVETSSTQQPSTESPSTSGQVVSTAQPTTVTTTTSVPSTSTLGTTPIAVETTTQAETTTGAIVSTSTVPPKVETTGPTTTATTVVVETSSTQQPSTESPSTSGQVVSTAQPTTVTTTTSVPSTSTFGTTPIAVETTTQAETTTGAIVSTSTVPPTVETTGPTTTSTPLVVETGSTSAPPKTSGQLSSTVQPSTGTSTSTLPTSNTVSSTASTAIAAITKTVPHITGTEGTLSPTLTETTTEVNISTSTEPPKVETTGPTTTATTVVVETSSTQQLSTTSSFSTSTAPQTTTMCFCTVNNEIYQQGDLIYNVTDEAGWCYTAHCNSSCQVEVKSNPCPSTAPPTPTTTQYSTPFETKPTTPSEVTSTAPASSSTPLDTFDCNKLQPPRQEGEMWQVNQCTYATCSGGKVIELPVSCPPVKVPSCENGRAPVKVLDGTGCCYQNECECVCSVWGESHYLTFDGLSYNFKQNCSYYLVKEILPKYELEIVLDNNYCATSASSFCPQTLIISYRSYQIVMTQLTSDNTITNVAYINKSRVYTPYSKDGLNLTSTGMALTLTIPAILAEVVYTNSAFSINLPYSLFEGNTEGQCGTCDNSQVNDCRSPNGTPQNCGTSAPEWQVSDKDCLIPPTTLPPTISTPSSSSVSPASTLAPCRPAICEIMNSKVFEACHSYVPPNAFVEACRSDLCSGANNSCSSLEAYASECSKAGMCIDWRNATNGQCVHICPNTKVYMPCGPVVQPTCTSGMQPRSTNDSSATKEGCFCPNDTILFSSYSDTCVPSCDCTGPEGQPKQYGETWTSGCKLCTCDEGSMSVQCQPIPCPPTPNIICSEPGFKLVTKTVDCCLNYTCECDISLCPASMVVCQPGFEPFISTNSTCCPTTECVPKGVCVYKDVEYKPGSKVPSESCEECTCGYTMDPTTQLNKITCIPMTCQTSCPQGYEYQTVDGQCCGKCVQTSCVVMLPDSTTHIVQINETWSPPNDKCVKYTCEINNGLYVSKMTETLCPAFNPENCIPGTETTDANGCCRTCTSRSVCEVQTSSTNLEMNGCNSTLPVEITFCAGACHTSSIYSMEANMVTHQCTCCQEVSTSQKQVELTCGDGSTVKYTYVHINTCACRVTACQEATTTPASQKRRRRR